MHIFIQWDDISHFQKIRVNYLKALGILISTIHMNLAKLGIKHANFFSQFLAPNSEKLVIKMIDLTWILDFLRLQQVSYVSPQKIVLSGKRSGWVSLMPDLTLKNNVSNTPNCAITAVT